MIIHDDYGIDDDDDNGFIGDYGVVYDDDDS